MSSSGKPAFWIGIGCALLAIFVLLVLSWKGWAARFVSWSTGPGAGQRAADDLATAVMKLPPDDLGELTDWAVNVLKKFNAGSVQSNGPAAYWSMGDIELKSAEISPVVTRVWYQNHAPADREPQVSIRLAPSGKAEAIIIGWYLRGIVVGNSNYSLTFSPWYSRKVQTRYLRLFS